MVGIQGKKKVRQGDDNRKLVYLVGFWLFLCPIAGFSNSFNGLGELYILIFSAITAIPALIILIGFLIATHKIQKSQKMTDKSKGIYALIVRVVSGFLFLLLPLIVIFYIRSGEPNFMLIAFVCWLPVMILSIISYRKAGKIKKE